MERQKPKDLPLPGSTGMESMQAKPLEIHNFSGMNRNLYFSNSINANKDSSSLHSETAQLIFDG